MDAVYRSDPITASSPKVGRERALEPSFFFEDRPAERARLRRTARFALIGDLSQCYSSIYTHSLSWALAGKAREKASLRTRTPVPGDELDRSSRNLQLGQTKGMPIGPDSSLAFAELVLAAVDIEMAAKIASHWHTTLPALRITDDLEYFASSRTEAEDALLAWEMAAASFELQVSPAKTRTIELPTALTDHWPIALQQFTSRSKPLQIANDLTAYVSIANEMAGRNSRSAVSGYAIQRTNSLPSVFTEAAAWSVHFNLLLVSVIVAPADLRYLADVLQRAATAGLPLDKDALAGTLQEIVSYHAPLEHGAEVSWALFIMHEHAIPLSSANATKVAGMFDNVSLLLLQCLNAKGIVDGDRPDLSEAITRAESSGVACSSDWRLAYEMSARNWCNPAEMRNDPWLGPMLDAGVAFLT